MPTNVSHTTFGRALRAAVIDGCAQHGSANPFTADHPRRHLNVPLAVTLFPGAR